MKIPKESSRAPRMLSTTLATAFFSFNVLILFLYVGLETFSDFGIQKAALSNLQQHIAHDAAGIVHSFIQENFSVLETAISLTDPGAEPVTQQRRILQSLLGLRPAFRQLVLLDARNKVLVQSSRLSMAASRQYTDRLKDLFAGQDNWTRKRTISPVYIDPATNEPMAAMAVPVTNVFGDFKGTLIAEVPLKSMWSIVDQFKVGKAGYMYVVDREGNLIAFEDTARVLKGENVSRIKAVTEFINDPTFARSDRAFTYQGIRGVTVVGTYIPLKAPDWAVITELPWQEAYRDIFHDFTAAAVIGLSLAILTAIFGMFMARRLAVPVIKLTETATRIAAGERDLQAGVSGPREVARLAVAFNSMTFQLRRSLKDLEQQFGELKRTEEALRLSEERLRLALEGTSDGIWDWDLKSGQVYFSPRYFTMLGYDPAEFPPVYESWRRLLHPEDVASSERVLRHAIEEKSAFAMEFRFRGKNEEWRWILGRGKVVETDASGRAARMAGSHTDITERKRAEEALRTSRERLSLVIEGSNDGFWDWDVATGRTYFSGRYYTMLGYAADEFPASYESWRSLIHPQDLAATEARLRQHLEAKLPAFTAELRLRTRSGDYRWILARGKVVERDAEGKAVRMSGTHTDISERKQAEEALLREKHFSNTLIDSMPGVLYVFDEQGRFVRWNNRFESTSGYTADEIRHIKPTDLFVDTEKDYIVQKIQEVLSRGEAEAEAGFRTRDGRTIPYYFTGLRILFDGNPHILGVGIDISERKRVEEALEKRIVALTRPLDTAEGISFEDLFNLSEIQRLQDLYAEAFGVAALITRPDGSPITQPSNFTELCSRIIRKNPRGAENCNYSDATVGRHNPSGPNIQPCLSAGLCNAGASITVGGHHVANWLIGQVRNEAQKEEDIMAYARELGVDEEAFRTAYRKVPVMSQEQFERAAHVLFELANQISTTAYQNVQQARFITDRKRAEETLRKYERIVSTSQDLMALINNDYIYEAVNDSFLRSRNKAREEVVGRTVAEVMGEGAFREKIQPQMDRGLSGQTVHHQEIFDTPAGGRRIMEVKLFPMMDAKGSVEGIVFNARDITETRKLEEQLMQSQKIESLGTLAGGVAHEINNPINGIMNYAQLILDRMEPENPAREFAQEILHETHRVAEIVRNLLTFARHEKQSHSPAHISDIVSAVLSLVQTVMRHDQISLELSIPDDLPKLKCRSQQIQQVLMNLMTNARDAINERYPDHNPAKRLLLSAVLIERQGRKFIRTTVEDAGAGIAPEIRDRIFDPFFTTKPKEIGTGLGLSISYGIVKDHGGELSVESEQGRSTRFHMDLPVDNGWTLGER